MNVSEIILKISKLLSFVMSVYVETEIVKNASLCTVKLGDNEHSIWYVLLNLVIVNFLVRTKLFDIAKLFLI